MITEIEDYFTRGCGRCERFDTPDCSIRQWHRGLLDLRQICREAGLSETVKWGHPCYRHAGRNLVIIGAFRQDFRLSFFNAALMRDPAGVLEKQGENTRHKDMIRFTAVQHVAEKAEIIRSYLAEAKDYAEAGVKPAKDETELDLPQDLADALAADPVMAAAFNALTPGRQRGYVINLNGAKKPETRLARITQFRPKIIAGKGAMER